MGCMVCDSPEPCECGRQCPECGSENTRTHQPEPEDGHHTPDNVCDECTAIF